MERATRELLDTIAKSTSTPIEEARALPALAYVSEEVFQLEVEHIFRKEWLYVGREEQVAGPGDYLAFDLVGEPIVIVRDEAGTLHALSNVCRHRYMQLVEGQGHADKFVCPYHGWTYQLDGALAGAPHMTESRIFERRGCRLPEFRLETWLGSIFVNLDPQAEPFAPRHEAAFERLAPYRLDQMRIVAEIDEVWDGNWKLGFENGTETYHVSVLHANTVASWNPTSAGSSESGGEVGNWLLTDLDLDQIPEDSASFVGLIRRGGASLPERDRGLFIGYNIYPNLIVDINPGHCLWLSWLPIDATHVHVHGRVSVFPEEIEAGGEAFQSEQQEWMNAVNAEDAEATWRLQKAMASHHSVAGPLSVREENMLRFQRYLARRLT